MLINCLAIGHKCRKLSGVFVFLIKMPMGGKIIKAKLVDS